ncbi:MAG: hypothetical protein BWX70_00309 [Verrucomicrobia bacterium ADurb.Bin070]|nr:MAG: hypothetical protein BWX70_00309 [Verrucomicrobia bacterium ADurb.Bin070]
MGRTRVVDQTEGAGLIDLAVKRGRRPRVIREQARLIVVGLGGEIDIACGDVKQPVVILQGVIALDAEGHILIAILLHQGGDPLVEGLTLIHQQGPLGDKGAVLFGQRPQLLRVGEDVGAQVGLVVQRVIDTRDQVGVCGLSLVVGIVHLDRVLRDFKRGFIDELNDLRGHAGPAHAGLNRIRQGERGRFDGGQCVAERIRQPHRRRRGRNTDNHALCSPGHRFAGFLHDFKQSLRGAQHGLDDRLRNQPVLGSLGCTLLGRVLERHQVNGAVKVEPKVLVFAQRLADHDLLLEHLRDNRLKLADRRTLAPRLRCLKRVHAGRRGKLEIKVRKRIVGAAEIGGRSVIQAVRRLGQRGITGGVRQVAEQRRDAVQQVTRIHAVTFRAFQQFGAVEDILQSAAGQRPVAVELHGRRGRFRERAVRGAIRAHVHVKHQIRPQIAVRVEFTGADRPGIGAPKDLDKLIAVRDILLIDVVAEILLGHGDGAEPVLRGIGRVPRRFGISQSFERAVKDLFEMRTPEYAVIPTVGIDVERHGFRGHPQRGQAVVRIIQGCLDLVEMGGNDRDVDILPTVDFLNARESFIGMLGGQQGIGRDPIEVRPLSGAARPILNAPSAVAIDVGVALPLRRLILDVMLTIGVAHDLRAGLRFLRGDLRELAFIKKIHFHDDIVERIELGARDPVEEGMAQKIVLLGQGGEIVAPRIAMTLRIKGHRVIFVDESVLGDVADGIVHGVGRLTLTLGEVPEEPVVDRTHHVVILPAQKIQFLFQQRSGLVLEGEDGRRGSAILRR